MRLLWANHQSVVFVLSGRRVLIAMNMPIKGIAMQDKSVINLFSCSTDDGHARNGQIGDELCKQK